MKIFMSLWTKPKNNIYIDMWKLSLSLAQKHYTNIDLITDKRGFDMLKKLPFSNFHVVLDNIPNYTNIWSLGKIYSYKHACSQDDSFLHIDSDVFLWDPLPTQLLNNDLFCQSEDFDIGQVAYDLNKLSEMTSINLQEMPKIWIDNISLKTYNMGIFGGKQNLIQPYCNMVLDMMNDTKYLKLWNIDSMILNMEDISTHISCLIEQANFAIYCNDRNILPYTLFKNLTQPEISIKYTHLMRRKNNSTIQQAISSRVSSEPYNLIPKNIY